ncbi:MAG: GH36 C-terminal domain-containing protein [Anaerolineales bacterium]|nr:GH36 C-terminal domain-containing protein [Anaerolineales bacterium]
MQLGDQYRLLPAQDQQFTAIQYVSKDKTEGVLFVFRTHIPEPAVLPPVYLQGLDPPFNTRSKASKAFAPARHG